MTKHAGPVRGILSESVWASGGISSDDERVRGLLRVVLPVLDGCLIVFGLGSSVSGVPALRDVFDPPYPQAWGVAIAVAAFLCVVGLAWPRRLWKLERGAKSLLAFLLVLYSGALVYAGVITADVGRASVGALPLITVSVLVWRIWDVTKDAKRNGWPGAPS